MSGSKADSRPLVLTPGEPAGIGGVIALRAWLSLRLSGRPVFVLIDDPKRMAALAAALGLDVPIRAIDEPGEAAACFADALPVLPMAWPAPPVAGQLDPANAQAVVAAIEQAVALVQAGRAKALVTNPIHKETLYRAGFAHPGHTEFLAHLAGGDLEPVMMLAGRDLRVVPVTVHVALAQAIRSLTAQRIVSAGRIVAQALGRDFGIARPRLVVAGLNPHAGEGGAMGLEDGLIVAPAVAELQALGLDVRGPLPADTLFHEAARATYDAALCHYHDQALIPIKTLDFHGAVNVTLGLPFVRTSPDHGTALDRAASGDANPASLIAALDLAARMADRRHDAAAA
ncbi:MAG: 4-hydroxythreonine-4-phosphate dehydrogenase PdxA [Rhodospirillales bacterium]|nr:4-hydroxythreonine-4-phosphate dehydrogenase PdxA [Rhodospirillales bacterium]